MGGIVNCDKCLYQTPPSFQSAVGADYHSEASKHASQQDYAKGFGGRYGVQSDRQDKVILVLILVV